LERKHETRNSSLQKKTAANKRKWLTRQLKLKLGKRRRPRAPFQSSPAARSRRTPRHWPKLPM